MSTPRETVETSESLDVEGLAVSESIGEEVLLESGRELDLDTTFELLRNRRRRIVLSHLVGVGERVSMGELAEHVAAVENDTTVQALSSTERKRAYVGLYQCHLPKLAEAGVVDYNRDRGHVEAAPVAEELLEYVDRDGAEGPNWTARYLAATGVVAGVYLACLALSTVVAVPWHAVGALALVPGVVALAHAREEGYLEIRRD